MGLLMVEFDSDFGGMLSKDGAGLLEFFVGSFTGPLFWAALNAFGFNALNFNNFVLFHSRINFFKVKFNKNQTTK